MCEKFVIGEYVKCVGKTGIYVGQITYVDKDPEVFEDDYLVRIITKNGPKKLALTGYEGEEGFDYCDFGNNELFNLIKIDQTYGKQRFEEKKLELL